MHSKLPAEQPEQQYDYGNDDRHAEDGKKT